MISSKKKLLLVTTAIFVVGASFFIGFFTGTESEAKNTTSKAPAIYDGEDAPKDIDFSIFWKTWNKINEKYVSTDGPSDQEKIYGAISGLVDSLGDPYSVFFPPKESKNFESEIQGSFEGVGMEVGKTDDILTVIAPLKKTPAEKAGVQAGDKVIAIDDTPTVNLTVDESVDLIRGKGGTPVKLTIIRKDEKEPLEIKIIRGTIEIPTINTIKRDDGIFVIELYSFSAKSPYLFRDALREFVKSGDDKLILDLRNNPGGFLEAAVDIASWFLPAGKVVVRETSRDGDVAEKAYRSKGYNIFTDKLKFVVLINQGSASASEILAGALSEYGKAILIGEKSFGKGSVQELIPITKDTSLKITVAKWLTPNRVSISKNGLKPNIKVEYTKKDFEDGVDPQLKKAVETLKNM